MEKADEKVWNNTWKKRKGDIAISDMDKLIFNELCKHVDIKDREAVELGCGRGVLSFLTVKKGVKAVTLVDFSEEALIIAKELFVNVANVEFIKSDLFELDEGKKYDIVFSSGVAEHFSGRLREEVIHKHLRLTKDVSILIVPARPHFNTIRHKRKKVMDLYGWQYAFSKEEINRIVMRYTGYDIILNKRFYPLYGVNLLELLGGDGESIFSSIWNLALHLADTVLNKVRFYKFFNMVLSIFAHELGGLIIVIVKKKHS